MLIDVPLPQCAEMATIALGFAVRPNSARASWYGPRCSATIGEPWETKTAGITSDCGYGLMAILPSYPTDACCNTQVAKNSARQSALEWHSSSLWRLEGGSAGLHPRLAIFPTPLAE